VIKTLEAQIGQLLLGCKCPVSRFFPARAKDLSAPLYISVLLIQYRSGDQIEKNEMGEACSAYGGHESCIQGFGKEI
jgi:hypothetical protein